MSSRTGGRAGVCLSGWGSHCTHRLSNVVLESTTMAKVATTVLLPYQIDTVDSTVYKYRNNTRF